MAKDNDVTPIARDFAMEVLSGKCVIQKGGKGPDGKVTPDVNECDMRYESAQKEVIVALQTKYGSQAVKALRGSKQSVGEIARALETARLEAEAQKKGK